MGRSRQPQPRRLRFKLYAIRKHLDLSLRGLAERLGYDQSPIYPSYILEYEQGKRTPALLVLLRYARIAEVTMEMLVDDEMKLPEHLQVYAARAENKYETERLKESFKEALDVIGELLSPES